VDFQYRSSHGSDAREYLSARRDNLLGRQQETVHPFVRQLYRVAVFYAGFPFGPVVRTPYNGNTKRLFNAK